MKFLKNIFVFLIFWLGCVAIYFIQHQHYSYFSEYYNKQKWNPQSLLDWKIIKEISFGFSSLVWDKYWIDTILYTGWNAAGWFYKKAVYSYINTTTDIIPKFTEAYPFSQLLLANFSIDDSIKIWLKGIENNCDKEKLDKIDKTNLLDAKYITFDSDWIKLNDLFWKEHEDLKNPCKTFEIPYYLWFAYLTNKKDYENAKKYMTYAMLQEESVPAATSIPFNLVWKLDSYVAWVTFWRDTYNLAVKNKLPEEQILDIKDRLDKIYNLYMINEWYLKAIKDKVKFDYKNPEELMKNWYVDAKYIILPKEKDKTEEEREYIYFYNDKTNLFDYKSKYDK